MDNGAHPALVNSDGDTPYDIAEDEDIQEVLQTATDSQGNNWLDHMSSYTMWLLYVPYPQWCHENKMAALFGGRLYWNNDELVSSRVTPSALFSIIQTYVLHFPLIS